MSKIFDITKTSAYKQAMDSKNPDKQAELNIRSRVYDQYFAEKQVLADLEMGVLKASIELEKAQMTSNATASLRTSVDAVMADKKAVETASATVASLTKQLEERTSIFNTLFGA